MTVTPVVCRDSMGTPYEVALVLRRDGLPYGTVGERCGWQLARLARDVAEARADDGPQAGSWPDPDDRFPAEPPGRPAGELLALRHRARTDVAGAGELRCRLRTTSTWGPEEWRVTRRAYVEAWGLPGVGLRAVLTSAELGEFVGRLVREAEERLGARYDERDETESNSNLARGHDTRLRRR